MNGKPKQIFAKFSFRPMADPSTPQPRHRALINRTVLRWHFNNNNLENLIKHCLVQRVCVCGCGGLVTCFSAKPISVLYRYNSSFDFIVFRSVTMHIVCVCVCAIVHNGNLNGNCRLNKFCSPLAPLPRAFLVR